MQPYQRDSIDKFLKLLPSDAFSILEIGSDIPTEVTTTLAQKTGVMVIGINPAFNFPDREKCGQKEVFPFLIRGDGLALPFSDNSFDAILSIATLEHVSNVKVFMAELTRVMKPRGVFYTDFGPIWSSARGHHVYAKWKSKEARFWKPGKNPVPDYAHLLMSPDEMKMTLRAGPCCEELIEPIIHWIYHSETINRCHFEEYIDVFRKSSLWIYRLDTSNNDNSNSDIIARLYEKYGTARNFTCSNISAVLIKFPKISTLNDLIYCSVFYLKSKLRMVIVKWYRGIVQRFPEIRWLKNLIMS